MDSSFQPMVGSEIKRLREIDQHTLWHPFTQMKDHWKEEPEQPLIIAADGNYLIDAKGKKYFDANSGYWCLALGCRPKEVEKAIADQMNRFSHSTLLGLTHQPVLELSERLTKLAGAPLNHVFYADSGSEAVEVALKMTYQYQVHRGRPERSKFLALGEAYHGDTLGATSVGGVDLFHKIFKPLLFNVKHVPPPQCGPRPLQNPKPELDDTSADGFIAEMEKHKDELAAVIIEPLVQGPGGIIPQSNAFPKKIVERARELDIPVIFDEVAVGMGRLGTLFAFEQIGVKPDLVCMAKGLTGGIFPMSAVLVDEKIYKEFLGSYAEQKTFFHGHTYTGSALGSAAALAALGILSDSHFLQRLQESIIPALWEALTPLEELDHVKEVRGRGMMAGLELIEDKQKNTPYDWPKRMGHKTVLALRKRGVQTRSISNVLLCVPPLTTTIDEIKMLGEAYREAILEVTE